MKQLIINITNSPYLRIEVIRVDGKIPNFSLSVEEQAINTDLGVICNTSNLDEVIKAIKDIIKEEKQ